MYGLWGYLLKVKALALINARRVLEVDDTLNGVVWSGTCTHFKLCQICAKQCPQLRIAKNKRLLSKK